MDHDRAFLGTGWSFPPEFDRAAKAVKMVSGEEDIQESLGILLETVPGERVLQPSYGCSLKRLVFEQVSESTITEIKDLIERAVLFFEPRISLTHIEVDAGQVYEGLITIRLDYTVRLTNTRSNMVYPFYFLEGTNLRA